MGAGGQDRSRTLLTLSPHRYDWVTSYKVQVSNDTHTWHPCRNGTQDVVGAHSGQPWVGPWEQGPTGIPSLADSLGRARAQMVNHAREIIMPGLTMPGG